MKSCVYPGSFDPFTLGHLNIVKRAADIYDKVYVLVGNNTQKNYTFDLTERVNLIKSNVSSIQNVEVMMFDGLLVDTVYEMGASAVVKGVRTFQDFDYEKLLHEIGLTQQRGIETVILYADKNLSQVSSSATKEICKNYGILDEYVPLNTKSALERKLINKKIIGLTGNIGMGKSYVAKKIKLWFEDKVHHIDLDAIAYDILHNRTENVYIKLRTDIISKFKLKSENGEINRKELGDIVFKDKNKLNELNMMFRLPILTRIRREMSDVKHQKKPIVLLDGALLAEGNFLKIVNNQVIVVNSTKEQQIDRLTKRGMTDLQIKNRIDSQFSNEKKVEFIKKSIEEHNFGILIEYDNDSSVDDYKNLYYLMEKIRNI